MHHFARRFGLRLMAGWLIPGLFACSKPIGDPRQFNLSEIIHYVCQGQRLDQQTNACGERSVWREADGGTTAYITVYGVSAQDGEAIAKLIEDEKARSKHSYPVVLTVFSTPRSQGRSPSSARVFNANL
jgi:hypothetical protein